MILIDFVFISIEITGQDWIIIYRRLSGRRTYLRAKMKERRAYLAARMYASFFRSAGDMIREEQNNKYNN